MRTVDQGLALSAKMLPKILVAPDQEAGKWPIFCDSNLYVRVYDLGSHDDACSIVRPGGGLPGTVLTR